MARSEFGGTFESWVVTTGTADAEGSLPVVLPAAPVTLEIYDNPNGAIVTDFLDEAGTPVTAIAVPAGSAYIPRFSGPDGLESLWHQEPGGRWLPIPRWDDGSGGTGGGVGDVLLAGGNEFEYGTSQDPNPWLRVDVPDDGSNSSTWANRLEFRFWDNSTSQYRHGFHVNEKGLARARGVTPDDVPARWMAHPAQVASVPVMETTKSDNTQKLLQSFETKTVSVVEMHVPYLVNEQGERLYFGTQDPNDGPYPPNVGDAWLDYNGV